MTLSGDPMIPIEREQMHELLERARAFAHRAWVPYSHFPVGAAVLTERGEVIAGCNVENAAYGEAICAERNAVTTMVATAERDISASDSSVQSASEPPRIYAVAVVGLHAAPCWPCGACRQVLREFHCRYVIVEGVSGEPQVLPFECILPYSFGSEVLDGVGFLPKDGILRAEHLKGE